MSGSRRFIDRMITVDADYGVQLHQRKHLDMIDRCQELQPCPHDHEHNLKDHCRPPCGKDHEHEHKACYSQATIARAATEQPKEVS